MLMPRLTIVDSHSSDDAIQSSVADLLPSREESLKLLRYVTERARSSVVTSEPHIRYRRIGVVPNQTQRITPNR